MISFHVLYILLFIRFISYSSASKEKWNKLEDYDRDFVPYSRRFYIGAVLPNLEADEHFKQTIKKLNFDGKSIPPSSTLYHETVISSGNPIRDARLVCSQIIPKSIFALILGGGSSLSSAATAAISYTAGFYHIPVIGTIARESAFSDKNIHVSFMRTVPSYTQQASVWIELLKHLKYSRFVFIHSSDSDGRALLGTLQSLFANMQHDQMLTISSVIDFEPGLTDQAASRIIQELHTSMVRVFIFHANKEDSEVLLQEAQNKRLMDKNSVWILSECSSTSRNIPIGAIYLKLRYADNQNAHLNDGLRLVGLALKKLMENSPELILNPPNTCKSEDPWNITGKLLFKEIREQVLIHGETGKLAFDNNGDRLFAEYDIINVQKSTQNTILHRKVGEFRCNKLYTSMKLRVNESRIQWGKSINVKPSGVVVPRHLKILTMEEIPFLFYDDIELGRRKELCRRPDEVLCYWEDPVTAENHTRCCYGYVVELIQGLAKRNNFSFSLKFPPDGEYGESYITENGVQWTGMIGELTNESSEGDLIVAPLTINPERARDIDFSKPFKYQGITILVKKQERSHTLVSILQPFQANLWFMLLVTVHAIALLLYALDRFSPMFKREGTETDSLKLSEAFWFSWGVILNSGLGEGTPRCLSSRVMSLIWAGFAMIIVASYTANLAAFLVLEDHRESITGINDAKLRNPVEDFIFATVKGSSVDMFFRRKTEWANMYRMMETNNFHSADEAIKAVKNGSLQAFIWDSSRLEYEAAQDCNLVTVGELFGRSGYGIGLRKHLFWSEKITLDILEFHESGFMANLDEKWIWNGLSTCPLDRGNAPQHLGLGNLEGIFMMVVCGIIAGTILIVLELLYAKYRHLLPIRHTKTTRLNLEEPLSSEITKVVLQDSTHVCELCEDITEGNNTTLCDFCATVNGLSEYKDPDDQNSSSGILDDIDRRLEQSTTIPTTLKSLSLRDRLQLYIKSDRMPRGSNAVAGIEAEDMVYMINQIGFTTTHVHSSVESFSSTEELKEFNNDCLMTSGMDEKLPDVAFNNVLQENSNTLDEDSVLNTTVLYV